MATSYAQNAEDLILALLLKKVKRGFYVDVGANHPDNDSVTKLFYKRGWRGINIEPIPSLYKKFIKARPRDINVNKGVSRKPGKMILREYSGELHGLSTFSKKIMESRTDEYTEYPVVTEPLKKILTTHKVKEIDFLKIDVEGLEDEVVEGNDWTRFRPKIIVVENTPGNWKKTIPNLGYQEVLFDGLNRYYAREDLVNEYVPLLFMRAYNEEYIQPIARQLEDTQAQLAKMDTEYKALQKKRKIPQGLILAKTRLRNAKNKFRR